MNLIVVTQQEFQRMMCEVAVDPRITSASDDVSLRELRLL